MPRGAQPHEANQDGSHSKVAPLPQLLPPLCFFKIIVGAISLPAAPMYSPSKRNRRVTGSKTTAFQGGSNKCDFDAPILDAPHSFQRRRHQEPAESKTTSTDSRQLSTQVLFAALHERSTKKATESRAAYSEGIGGGVIMSSSIACLSACWADDNRTHRPWCQMHPLCLCQHQKIPACRKKSHYETKAFT